MSLENRILDGLEVVLFSLGKTQGSLASPYHLLLVQFAGVTRRDFQLFCSVCAQGQGGCLTFRSTVS